MAKETKQKIEQVKLLNTLNVSEHIGLQQLPYKNDKNGNKVTLKQLPYNKGTQKEIDKMTKGLADLLGVERYTFQKHIQMFDGRNIQAGRTTGTIIGTVADQKIGFWGTTPIVKPTTGVSAASFVANTSGISDDTATFDGYTLGQVVKALRNAGLLT